MSTCILAIETSTPLGHVAVLREGEIIFDQAFRSQRSHNSQLFRPLGEALEICGSDLHLIVTGTGPGSYTGARIGIAAAQGLAWSRGVPVIGLPSVLAPDVAELPASFVVCGDARRSQFYAAHVRAGRLLQAELPLMNAAEFVSFQSEWSREPWFTFDEKSPADLAGVELVKPSAAHLARIAAGLPAEEVARLASLPLEPVYLSAPFITQAKKKG